MLKRINTSNQDLSLVQDNVDSALIPLQNQPMSGGVLLKGITLVASQDNLVPHGLGRVPQIFFIGNLDQDTAVWTTASTQIGNVSANTLYINLLCSTTCTASVWIN